MKVKLGKALEYEQPSKYIVESEKYKDEYKTPVLTAGKSFILGYTNETTGIYNNLPVIIFDDFTTDVKFVDFPFKVKSSAMKMLQPSSNEYNLKYFYYLIKFLNFQPTSHQRHWISKFAEFEFNIPDRQKQDEIVEKLDKMAEILSLKDKELKKYDELIKSQFTEMFENKDFTTKKGSELFCFSSGKGQTTNNLSNNYEYPCYGGNGITGYSKNYFIDYPTIVIGRVGAYCGSIHLVNEKCWVTDNAIYISDTKNKDINLYFMKFVFEQANFRRFNSSAGQPKITQEPLKNYDYMLPPINLQNKFADFVKHIDKLKFSIKQSIEKLENCYNSLMQKYFN